MDDSERQFSNTFGIKDWAMKAAEQQRIFGNDE
jgi:hypothetical protein